jgi:2-polyprenyl-6-methoxyphenol hydroxylase-like FAD-dependent oxidoreductase
MHRQRLLDQFAGDLSALSKLIGRTETLRAYPIHDLPSIPFWHEGRALLIGDAAHAMSPSAGQGASLALEDAVYLGVCLADCDEPETAFRCFETERRPRAEQIVREGRRRGEYKAPQNGVQRWLRDLIVPLMLRIFASPRALSWIYDYRVPRQVDRGTSARGRSGCMARVRRRPAHGYGILAEHGVARKERERSR